MAEKKLSLVEQHPELKLEPFPTKELLLHAGKADDHLLKGWFEGWLMMKFGLSLDDVIKAHLIRVQEGRPRRDGPLPI